MEEKLVSIGIPTFNRSNLIKNAIQSALNQTYENIEIIISNNASTDKTIDILETFSSNKKIRVFHQEKNIGVFV